MNESKALDELRVLCAKHQKKGLHFILASVIIWAAILIVQIVNIPMLTKNLLTFCCAAPLMPLAYFISKIIKVDFQDKENPLTNLGILFSLNQIIYILIAMWVYNAVPGKMLMVFSMIFGAHLLPYGWLYKSRTYFVLAIFIPIAALIIGCNFENYILAIMMVVIEVLFSCCLIFENKKL